jgi:hypothetical protein
MIAHLAFAGALLAIAMPKKQLDGLGWSHNSG